MAYKPVEIDHRIGNHNTGRPEKYTAEFIENEANLLLKFFENEEVYFIKEFSISRKYPSQYLSLFAGKSEKFNEALTYCKDLQEHRLAKAGLKEKFNSWFTGLTLKNVSGWRDRQEMSGYIEGSESESEMKEKRQKIKDYLKGYLKPPSDNTQKSG